MDRNRFALAQLAWKFSGISDHDWSSLRRMSQLGVEFRNWSDGVTPGTPLWRELKSVSVDEKLLDQQMNYCARNEIDVVLSGDVSYPRAFSLLRSPPRALCVQGQAVWLRPDGILIVGSRRPSAAALTWMEQNLPPFLRQDRPLVISGGAMGIDQKAHAMAVLTGTPTLCLLPSGFHSVYPASLRPWLTRYLEVGGAVMSCFSPFERLHKGHFHVRNRLMVALSNLILLVEARRKSGSLMTAQWGMQLGKDIAVVPRCPVEHQGLGGLDLLFEGAHPIRDHGDIMSLWQTHSGRWLPMSSEPTA